MKGVGKMTKDPVSVLDKYGVTVGFRLEDERVITEKDINLFAEVSGDHNRVHLDDEFAKKTFFKGRIAHGAFSQALLSAIMAKLPGLVIFHSQNIKFLNPVRVGDKINIIAEVMDINKDNATVVLKNLCINQDGKKVVEGESKVRIFEKPM
jgi:3-hydroxybutyryl-CoA dehydratase